MMKKQMAGLFFSALVIGLVTVTAFVPGASSVVPSPLDKDKHVLAFYYNWYANTTNYSNATYGITELGDWDGWGGTSPFNWTYCAQHDPFSITTETQVLANNFTWDRTWMATADVPAWGRYDSNDPRKMRADFLNAGYAGIDTFIVTYWGPRNTTYGSPGSDVSFENMLNYASYLEEIEGIPNIPNLTIYFEHNRPDGSNHDRWPAEYGAREDAIAEELIYVVRQYGDHPKFMKVDGVPVIFIWATINSGTTIDRWANIVKKVKAEAGPVYFQAAISYGTREKGIDEAAPAIYAKVFDGFHVYLTGSLIRNAGADARPVTNQQVFMQYVVRCKAMGRNFATSVMPGYDDTNIRDAASGGSIKNRWGTVNYGNRFTYDGMWEDAISAGSRWVTIVTFNEWWEGTEIDTSFQYGNFYIERTRYWAQLFKST